MGIILGIISKHWNELNKAALAMILSNTGRICFFLIPIMIFRDGYILDAHIFKRSLSQIAMLAIFSVLINVFFTGSIMALLTSFDKWTLSNSVMFGISLVIPYSLEMVQALRELGQEKQLRVLLEAEHLIADFVLVTIFGIFYVMKMKSSTPSTILDPPLRLIFAVMWGVLFTILWNFVQRFMYNNIATIFILSIVVPCAIIYFGNLATGVYSLFSVGITAISVGHKKHTLSPQIEGFLLKFGAFLENSINYLICILAGYVWLLLLRKEHLLHQCFLVFVVYIISISGRVFSCLILSPILSRIGYGLTFKKMLIIVWSEFVSPISLMFGMGFGVDELPEDISSNLFHTTSLLMISSIINGSSSKRLLDLLGISKLSVMQRTNINICMRHLEYKRTQTISSFKMDRFLCDTDWDTVEQATQLQDPYKIELWKNDDASSQENINLFGLRPIICPDCLTEVEYEPSRQELKEMLREARLRILQARKMCYIRQYRNGLLSREAVSILSHAVEVGLNSPKPVMELDGLHRYFRPRCFMTNIAKTILVRCCGNVLKTKPPRKLYRRICHHIINSPVSEIFIYFIVIADVTLVLLELCHTGLNFKVSFYFLLFHTISFVIFLVEFLVKIFGYSWIYVWQHGIKTFFSSVWNIIEFLALCVQCVELGLEYSMRIGKWENYTLLKITPISKYLKITQLMRIFILLRIFRFVQACLLRHFNSKIDKRLMLAYIVGTGFVTAEEEIIRMLPQIVTNLTVRNHCRESMEADRFIVTQKLGIVQNSRPWIAITVKTKKAVRSTLRTMQDATNDLKDSGWLDEYGYYKLNDSLNERFKQVKRKVKHVLPISPSDLLKGVSWMSEPVYEYLYNKVISKTFDQGDIVCADGEVSGGIYIVVTGLLKLTYAPKTLIADRMRDFGILPVMDYISSANFQHKVEDYLGCGNSFGELSVLTGRQYDCTIIADTTCQVYLISVEVLTTAFALSRSSFRRLQSNIWKSISIRLGIALMMDAPSYQSHTLDHIKFQIQRSFILNLSKNGIFDIDNTVMDVILIEGKVFDLYSGHKYIAPCYIPRVIRKLGLANSEQPLEQDVNVILLIIPAIDYQPDFEEHDTKASEPEKDFNIRHTDKYTQGNKKGEMFEMKKTLSRGSVALSSQSGPSEDLSGLFLK